MLSVPTSICLNSRINPFSWNGLLLIVSLSKEFSFLIVSFDKESLFEYHQNYEILHAAAYFVVLVSTMFFVNWELTKGIRFYILYTSFVVDKKVEVGKSISLLNWF